jgi:hypothetical protein
MHVGDIGLATLESARRAGDTAFEGGRARRNAVVEARAFGKDPRLKGLGIGRLMERGRGDRQAAEDAGRCDHKQLRAGHGRSDPFGNRL